MPAHNLPLHRAVALFRFALMFLMNATNRYCCLAMIGAALCGCMPSSQNPLDEQKEMHFQTGKALQNALDNKGAIEAFEKALEANPRNGSAHFELGLLYEKEADFSAAIYHFERYLKLRPDSSYAQIVRERINADKMELSKTAAFAPVTQKLQREFEKLAEDNKQLAEENRVLRGEVEQWRAYHAGRATENSVARNPAGTTTSAQTGTPSSAGATSTTSLNQTSLRTHRVEAGETPSAIARKYRIKLDSLMAANPGLEPRRMKVGQALNIPAN